jgi:hypothetical protein
VFPLDVTSYVHAGRVSPLPHARAAEPDPAHDTGGTQDWLRTGDPPVQPGGDEEATVRVCVPLGWHAPQAEYVNELQVGGGDPAPHAGVQLPFAGHELTTSVM